MTFSRNFRQWLQRKLPTLQWRHNERGGVSNHRRLDWPFVQAQIKENIKAPRYWPLWGESNWQRVSNAKNVSIWWRHREHDNSLCSQWRKFHQNVDISVSVTIYIPLQQSRGHFPLGSASAGAMLSEKLRMTSPVPACGWRSNFSGWVKGKARHFLGHTRGGHSSKHTEIRQCNRSRVFITWIIPQKDLCSN